MSRGVAQAFLPVVWSPMHRQECLCHACVVARLLEDWDMRAAKGGGRWRVAGRLRTRTARAGTEIDGGS